MNEHLRDFQCPLLHFVRTSLTTSVQPAMLQMRRNGLDFSARLYTVLLLCGKYLQLDQSYILQYTRGSIYLTTAHCTEYKEVHYAYTLKATFVEHPTL